MKIKIISIFMAVLIAVSFIGCENESVSIILNSDTEIEPSTINDTVSTETDSTVSETSEIESNTDQFTERDLEQVADLDDATGVTLSSGQDMVITSEGTYVITGDVEDVNIIVEVDDEDKVQLVLDGVEINNTDKPAITVLDGDKVFITTTDSENTLEVVGNFDSDQKWDAVIYSKSDLVINGLGTLNIVSKSGNGITSKDDLKVTGSTINIEAAFDGLEANDSIRVADGDLNIESGKDGFHSENDDDTSLGYVYINGGHITITATDDAIRGTSYVQIVGGTIDIITCTEGIEATFIQVNDGLINIYSIDDGINASYKSDLDVAIELNGGEINVVMASGDTDAFDANGVIIINGGVINVEGGSSFDANESTTYNAGTVTVNGEIITDFSSIQQQGNKKQR